MTGLEGIIQMSSAKRNKRIGCDDSKRDIKGLMKMMKRSGDKTHPWGTPRVTGASSDLPEGEDTKNDLSVRNAEIQETINGGVPREIRRVMRMSWGTVSNALVMSKNMAGRQRR